MRCRAQHVENNALRGAQYHSALQQTIHGDCSVIRPDTKGRAACEIINTVLNIQVTILPLAGSGVTSYLNIIAQSRQLKCGLKDTYVRFNTTKDNLEVQ